jgi:hypothetical protein
MVLLEARGGDSVTAGHAGCGGAVDRTDELCRLAQLFDAGKMPEGGAEILWGEAEGVPHEEIAAELGISRTAVGNRLYRMRTKFRTRLAELRMIGHNRSPPDGP